MKKNIEIKKMSDLNEQVELEQLYAWSRRFRKFVCYPISVRFLDEITLKQLAQFLGEVSYTELAKALVLYPHDLRVRILWYLSKSIQKSILEDMKSYVKSNKFSLNVCINAEEKMQGILNHLWTNDFRQYKDMEEMEAVIALKTGKKNYLFSKDIHIKKEEQDIRLLVDVNLEEYHIHHDEPTCHSLCYGRSLEAYLFFLYGYVQKHGGKVYLDIKYAQEIPSMESLFVEAGKTSQGNQNSIDEEQYFLLIYRIRNLLRLYSWIILSDRLECQVQDLNCLLKKRNFFSKVTGNQFLDETAFSERIKAKFLDDIVKKNFSFWLFCEDRQYRRTCIRLHDEADLWWIKDSNLTLMFFGMASFEKSVSKLLMFMGLGIDLFLDNNLELLDVDRKKLGFEVGGYSGIKVSNIECILYDMAGVDRNFKEVFLILNNNCYNDRICFRYLEGGELSNEKLLELQEESACPISMEKTQAINHCYDTFLAMRIEGLLAIDLWYARVDDMPYQSENLLAVNQLFKIGLTGAYDWNATCERVQQYFDNRYVQKAEKELLQMYYEFYHLLFWHFENDTILTESEMIAFLLDFVPIVQRSKQKERFREIKETFRERYDKQKEEVLCENDVYWSFFLSLEKAADE